MCAMNKIPVRSSSFIAFQTFSCAVNIFVGNGVRTKGPSWRVRGILCTPASSWWCFSIDDSAFCCWLCFSFIILFFSPLYLSCDHKLSRQIVEFLELCSSDVVYRIHGHLAKHLRSKNHIMRLENTGKLPMGTHIELERNQFVGMAGSELWILCKNSVSCWMC